MSSKYKTRRKRNRNFVAIPFTTQLSLGTLGDNLVLTQGMLSAVFGEDIFIISIDWLASIRGAATSQMPITIGMAHGDLATTEIAEALDAELTDPDDIIAKERARRPVRRFGTFGRSDLQDMSLNDGRVARTKIKLSIGNGFDCNLWGRNQSGATLTTGTIIEFQGTIYGRWQR